MTDTPTLKIEALLRDLEAAPVIVNPDGNDGYIVTVIEDEVLGRVADRMAARNGWSDAEAKNLYVAMCEFISELGGVR